MILFFQENLKTRRKTDDGIIYELNTIIPTQSFSDKTNVSEQCKTLYDRVSSEHQKLTPGNDTEFYISPICTCNTVPCK